MERKVMSVVVLLSLWHLHGVQGARMLGELPPCKDVPGGIQNFDCYDPPATPLPPCDFKHQYPGIDCEPGRAMPAPEVRIAAAASTQDSVHELPQCKDVPGGIQFLDCYKPPATPLLPFDVNHQNAGFDCSTDSQKPQLKAVILAAASTQDSHIQLPPCSDVFDGIQCP